MTGMYAAVPCWRRWRAATRPAAATTSTSPCSTCGVVLPRQSGDELSGLRQAAAPHRQRPSQHPAAGRVRDPRRPPRARGRQRRPVRQVLRGARPAGTRRPTSASPTIPAGCAIAIELNALIADPAARGDTADWIAALAEARGVPCGPINTVPMVFDDEQVRTATCWSIFRIRGRVAVPQVVSPMRFAEAPLTSSARRRLLGQHTDGNPARARNLRTRLTRASPTQPTVTENQVPRIPFVDPRHRHDVRSSAASMTTWSSGPRGTVQGPLLAALHKPELADKWQQLGALLRYRHVLPPRLSETRDPGDGAALSMSARMASARRAVARRPVRRRNDRGHPAGRSAHPRSMPTHGRNLRLSAELQDRTTGVTSTATSMTGSLERWAHARRRRADRLDRLLHHGRDDAQRARVPAAGRRDAAIRAGMIRSEIDVDCYEVGGSMSEIVVEKSGKVVSVTLDRPPVNALTIALYREIAEVFDADRRLERRQLRRARPPRGTKAFCAGLDLKEFLAAKVEDDPTRAAIVRRMFTSVRHCAIPVIAAVNGPALGAGCVLASVCDIRLASENATFGLPEINVGRCGGTAHMARHLPQGLLRRMFFTGSRSPRRKPIASASSIRSCRGSSLLPAAHELAAVIAEQGAARAAPRQGGAQRRGVPAGRRRLCARAAIQHAS